MSNEGSIGLSAHDFVDVVESRGTPAFKRMNHELEERRRLRRAEAAAEREAAGQEQPPTEQEGQEEERKLG